MHLTFITNADMDAHDTPHTPRHPYLIKREGFTKIYLGQLPLDVTEQDLKEAFEPLSEINDIRVVKGNDKGQFMRYCYAFLEVKGDDDFTNEVIRKVNHIHPGWRINIRADYEKAQGRNDQRGGFDNRGGLDNRGGYGGGDFRPRDNYGSRDHRDGRDFRDHRDTRDTRDTRDYRDTRDFRDTRDYRDNRDQPGGTSNIPYMQPNFNNRLINYSEGERGVKRNRILVREVWLGGIPENISEHEMREIMSTFGIVESTEIFPKFAFIKFKLVADATNAFEKASIMHEKFGKSPGFRIFFSDPEKRIQIVGNHYEFDRQSEYIPVLFLGFPPVTSSFVDDMYMKSIGEQYGPIIETYMRKSNNPQTRSYILLTYDNVKNAIRAKQELSRRKDLLGDKRVEVAILLAEEPIFRGRNLENTLERYQAPNNYEKRSRNIPPAYNPNSFQPQMPPPYGQYPQYPQQPMYPNRNMGHQPMMSGPMMMPPPHGSSSMGGMNSMSQPMGGMGSVPSPMGGMMPSYYPPNMPMYYPPPYGMDQGYGHVEADKEQVVKIIESALNKTGESKPPIAPQQPEAQEHHEKDNKNPDWSGYLLRNKVPKVGADGYSKSAEFNFDDSIISIAYLLKLSDLKFKNKKYVLVLEATDQSSQKHFQGYVQFLLKKECAGVCLSYKELIFVIPKCPEADEVCELNERQLLVVMEDVTMYHDIKDKLIKVEE